MKITDVEAIALDRPAPEREYGTARRPIGRVSELPVRVYTDAGFYGIGEARGAGQGFARGYRQAGDGAVSTEIVAGKITLSDRPGWGIELDERTLERRGAWA